MKYKMKNKETILRNLYTPQNNHQDIVTRICLKYKHSANFEQIKLNLRCPNIKKSVNL